VVGGVSHEHFMSERAWAMETRRKMAGGEREKGFAGLVFFWLIPINKGIKLVS